MEAQLLCLVLLGIVQLGLGLDNGLAKTPPMGWLSWERYTCEVDCKTFPDNCINEKLYMRMADELVAQGYRDVGYEYVNIDDCWPALERGPSGELVADPVRFPSGIKALADYVHEKGLKLGIYLDIGTKTCGGYPGFNVPVGSGSDQYIKDVQLLASWGIDSLKVDGCNADVATMNVTYPKLGKALNQTGRPIVYYCSWPDYVRLNKDPVQFDLLVEYCNGWRIFDDIHDSYASVASIVDFWVSWNNTLSRYGQAGAWNDADMLLGGNTGLSIAQTEIQMVLWSMWGSPLLMSNDLSAVPADAKAVLQNTEVIAVSQDSLGRAGYLVSSFDRNQLQVWARPLHDGSVAVALVNLGSFGGPDIIAFTSLQLHLPSSSYSVRDLLKHQDLGTMNGTFTAKVLQSSVMLLKVTSANQ